MVNYFLILLILVLNENMLDYYWCTYKMATASLEWIPFTKVNGVKGWAHTFAAAAAQLEFLPGWVHRAAAHQVTFDNCIFVMEKKYKLNFIKKKSQNQKSIVFRI